MSDVETIVQTFLDAINDVDAIRELGLAIEAALGTLDAIPVLDAVTAPLTEVSQSVNSGLGKLDQTLDDFKRTLQRVSADLTQGKQGADRATQFLNEIVTEVPAFTNTLTILNCLLEIAKPLAQATAEGSKLQQNLSSIVHEYENVRDQVSKQIKPFTDALEKVSEGIAALEKAMHPILQEVKGGLDQAAHGFETADEVLRPVANMVRSAENAIKPVKWALEAARSVFDKVVTPVLDWILDTLGLRTAGGGSGEENPGHVGPGRIRRPRYEIQRRRRRYRGEVCGLQVARRRRGQSVGGPEEDTFEIPRQQAADPGLREHRHRHGCRDWETEPGSRVARAEHRSTPDQRAICARRTGDAGVDGPARLSIRLTPPPLGADGRSFCNLALGDTGPWGATKLPGFDAVGELFDTIDDARKALANLTPDAETVRQN